MTLDIGHRFDPNTPIEETVRFDACLNIRFATDLNGCAT